MKLSKLLFGLCVLFFVETLQAEDSPACTFWNKLAYNLTHASEQNGGVLQFACSNTCNSISCRGHFKFPPVLGISFEEDLCFGLRMKQCASPLAMDYFIIVPKDKVNSSGSISHNDSFDLPGPELYGIQSTIVVIVEMVRINASTIKFGVNTNVKASIGGLPDFVHKEKVLPPMYITVPPCTSDTSLIRPFKAPSVCTPLPKPSTHNLPTTMQAITTSKPVTTKRTYSSCELGVGNCGENEMCQATHEKSPSRSGVCVCQLEARYDPVTKRCISSGPSSGPPTTQSPSTAKKSTKAQKPTTDPSVTNAQTGKKEDGGMNTKKSTKAQKPATGPSVTVAQTGKKEDGGMNMTGVIIGAVFGGLLLIVVIVSVIVFIGRRRRQANYRGGHQLLSDNDDENDTNVVI